VSLWRPFLPGRRSRTRWTCLRSKRRWTSGFVDGVGQLLLGEDVGQVDQGAGEAGDWDVVDEGAVFLVDKARAVQDEALRDLPRPRAGDLDRLAAAQDSPQLSAGAVTRQGLLAARVNSSNQAGFARQAGVAYRVDAVVQRHQPPRLHPPPDSLPRQTRLPYLLPFHDPVLPARQGLNYPVRRVWAVKGAICVTLTAHTPMVGQRSRPVCDVCDD
jgi:hypothetical protein